MEQLSQSVLQSQVMLLHTKVKEHALSAVKCAVECGQLLLQVLAKGKRGDLAELIQATGIPERTAFRYMKLAEAYQNNQLPDGLGLTDLYRQLGIIKSAEVGGPGSEVNKAGKSLMVQIEMCFGVFKTNLQTFRSVPLAELQKLDRQRLLETQEELEATLSTIKQALQPTVDVEA